MRWLKSMRLNRSMRNKLARVEAIVREKPALSAGVISAVVIALLALVAVTNREPAAPDAQADRNAAKRAAARAAADEIVTPTAGEAAAKARAPKAAPVTITGCLERSDDNFRLKDTAGVDAPKSRSWKSGFLKKGPKPIDVIDASHRLKLGDHVGQRVTVTGVLVDREMQVRSLKRVAPSCS
jgi:hypothetical protein